MPWWAWLAAINVTALVVVALVMFRRRTDMAAGAATARADQAEADLQRLKKQAAIVATRKDRADVANDLDAGRF